METLITGTKKSKIYTDSVKIRYQVFVEEQKVPISLEIDENEGFCIYFVMYDDDKVAVATARLLPNDRQSNTVTLQRMAVLKEYRGLGYGRQMIEIVEKHIKEQHFSKIILHAQLSAKAFYIKMRYVPYGAEFEEAGLRHICMRKWIL
ncbi:MAG: GNAT family N-acetyltransferase [Bacteroidales bacterium]|jgi:predicted GNAT family N-acyltransferase|nr:GNAT family N-acetyltransferase [Bacteroidales bacterium]